MRYLVGYNRPVPGAVGNSPVEWHQDAATDNLEHAKEYCKNVRDNGHPKAVVFDTVEMKAIDL